MLAKKDFTLSENSDLNIEFEESPSSEDIKEKLFEFVKDTITWIISCHALSFFEFEKQMIPRVYALGRLFIVLFLCIREETIDLTHEPGYKRQPGKSRLLSTFFGKVRYWRTYIYSVGGGYYPLDLALGLTKDGFSMLLFSHAAKIATKMSYAQAVVVLFMFLRWSPSQKVVEEMVMGLGRHTQEWFETAPAPEGDGEVLIIQIDSKGTPTATEEELEKRRRPRKPNPHPESQRHKRRNARRSRGSKKRKKKGDKSKNAKMATIVVIYTLKRSEDGRLIGPINKKVYASYAPKRHVFAIARREADKRGFAKDSGKLVQMVMDGDNDLARYAKEFFPEAILTIDVFHVVEYLWQAGACLYGEGTDEQKDWVEAQKEALYNGLAAEIVKELDNWLGRIPKKGPGNKGRRERLQKVRDYLFKRLDKINYKSLLEQDLEVSSGAVEGAVNYVIAKRFDCGGMRWIKERSEALLQLRCIEVNNDWDDFISYVHDKTSRQGQQSQQTIFLKAKIPAPLPTYGLEI